MQNELGEFENVAEFLPESVREMVDIIGVSAVEKLVRKFGGGSFKLSDRSLYFDKLVEAIGKESAEKLLHYFGCDEIYIPRCEKALKILRNQRFYAAWCELKEERKLSGRMAMVELCPQFEITWRTGWEIVQKCERGQFGGQTTLF